MHTAAVNSETEKPTTVKTEKEVEINSNPGKDANTSTAVDPPITSRPKAEPQLPNPGSPEVLFVSMTRQPTKRKSRGNSCSSNRSSL